MFTAYQWISIIGIPSITGMLGWAVRQIIKIRKENKERENKTSANIALLMTAYQVQLRSTLMEQYKRYMKLGCVTDEDLQLWIDIYEQYHALGKNGVMDKRREQMLELRVVDDYK